MTGSATVFGRKFFTLPVPKISSARLRLENSSLEYIFLRMKSGRALISSHGVELISTKRGVLNSSRPFTV